MKTLFTVGGSQAAVFGVAPLAAAARNAGHEILLAADEPLMAAAQSVGLPAVCITSERMRYGQDGMTAAARIDALLELTRQWTPDLVVGGLSHVPRVLAAALKVPYVRHIWHIAPMARRDVTAVAELQPQLERLGLAELPDPDLFIDLCPPSLRPPGAPAGRAMRWVPRVSQRRVEPWMYTRPEGRRVLITAGTRNLMLDTSGSSLRRLVDELTGAGAEVLIAALPEAAERYGAELGDVRIGWIPLDVVAPTCDLAVHHGGATTAMTLVNAGVPQLIVPDNGYGKAVAESLSGFGAALLVDRHRPPAGQDPDEVVAAGCREILADPRYAERTRTLAAESAALPTPDEVLRDIEALAAR
ncbi:nucleotide disphospho-sugar-binding domain-containing protein [Streptomyces sp. NRRL S-813]|uniref:nucleotide disphospho-sugar-binding domain-containing protein n=1 Tax=Streptomyces sp. NRRL S-813 TaxID=1463919 RepID=UPI0004C0D82F|nr:nucleotide disphospho-sugar-binding domain-containing protein [Streptomyces sp. NRRL S-813]